MIQIPVFTIGAAIFCLLCLVYSVYNYKKFTKVLNSNKKALEDGIEIRNKMILLLQDRLEFHGLKEDYKHYSEQELKLPC